MIIPLDPHHEPGLQGAHTTPFVTAETEYLPTGHNSHVESDVAPVTEEFVPVGQKTRFVSPGQKYPGEQGMQNACPTLEYHPCVHALHVDNDVAPITFETLPAGQPIEVLPPGQK